MLAKIDITTIKHLELVPKYHDECLLVGKGFDKEDLQSSIDYFNPDIIFYGCDFDYNSAHIPVNTTAMKVVCMQDYWDEWDRRCNILTNNNIHGVITRNVVGLERYREKYPNVIFDYNICGYDDTIFTNISVEKRYDVLISGQVSDRYNGRKRLANIAKTLPSNMKVYHRPHCGWWYSPDAKKNEQDVYASELNSAIIAIAGTALPTQANMQKVWEISATSALCFTDLTPNEPHYDLLRQHVYEVDLSKSDEEIRQLFITQLENYNPEQIKRHNTIVSSYATMECRTKELIEKLGKMYQQYKTTRL